MRRAEPSGRLYVIVWAALIALTGLTVLVAGLARIGSAVVVALAIAAAKSSLVFLYFMHLRWEKRVLIRLLIPIALAVLAIFIGLTYTDVLYR
ncbi:MAG: cytochrome C oxidase subunit IV family protein [Methanothrix sp.]|nr:cytochrome C oxidase subunit IV family protein [Methanothrix sp.]